MAKVIIAFDPKQIAELGQRKGTTICSIFEPGSSYVDSEAYEGTRFDSNVYGAVGGVRDKSAYAVTNVPMSVPLAQFNMAVLAEPDSNGVRKYEFQTEDHKEIAYYKQLGFDMAEQGFTVTIEETKAAAGDDSKTEAGTGSNDGEG